MTGWFGFILAIIKAVPSLKSWWDQLVALYVADQLDKFQKADRDAIRKAVYEHDQRDLEGQIGNINPGKPSGLPGTHIVDSLPGVVPNPKAK